MLTNRGILFDRRIENDQIRRAKQKRALNCYDSNLNYCAYSTMKTLDEIKAERKQEAENTEVKRVYFDNMLISGDWAAIYYKVVETDLTTGEKTVSSRMEFLHFEENGDSVKVKEC